MAENAPKSPDAKRDGVTTNAQSGTGTGASGHENLPSPSPSGQSGGMTGKVTSPSQPAGTAPGTGDAGSEANLKRTEEQKRNQTAKDNEKMDEETGVVSRVLEDKEGNKTYVSSVSTEEADKHIEKTKNTPVFENQTQSLLGTVGNVNLTQDGRLAGDKSLRDDRDLEEVHAEIADKAGPNPLPNREGNELTKQANYIATSMGTGALGRIDRDTSAMASEIRELSKKNTLTNEDKDRLEEISKKLDSTGRI